MSVSSHSGGVCLLSQERQHFIWIFSTKTSVKLKSHTEKKNQR